MNGTVQRGTALIIALLVSAALARPASAQVDIIRGQIVGPDGKPLDFRVPEDHRER